MRNLLVLGFDDDKASAQRVFELLTDTPPRQELLQIGDAAFLNPLFGLVVGAASGAIGGKLDDSGIDDKTIEAIKPYGPTLLQSSLGIDDQAALAKALQD